MTQRDVIAPNNLSERLANNKKPRERQKTEKNMEERFMIHYAEVGLKGKNRAFFEKRLVQNVKQSLRGTGYARCQTAPRQDSGAVSTARRHRRN